MSFVHRFVPGLSPGGRTFVLLHGTGGDETSLLDIGPLLDPDANMLGVRGTSTDEGVNRYFRRFEEGRFDEADLVEKAHELAAFLAEMRATYQLGELTLVGYSNGANMAAALLLLHPDGIKSAVLLRAMLPILPPKPPNLNGRQVLILSGAADRMIPLDSAGRLAEVLESLGATVDHRVAPVGHALGREDILAAANWLTK